MNAYQRVLDKRISHKYKNVCFCQLSRDFHIIYASKALAELGFNTEHINNTTPLFTNFIIPREVDFFVTEVLTCLDVTRKKLGIDIHICPESPSDVRSSFCLLYRTINSTTSETVFDCYIMNKHDESFLEAYSNACEMEIDLLYKYSLDKLDMPVAMTQDLYFNYVNTKMADILGYSLDRMHNMRISGIMNEEQYHQQAEREVKHYHGELTGKTAVSMQTSEHEILEMDVIGCPMYIDSVPTSINMLVDITQRKIDTETLGILYGVLGEISEGVFIFDATPKITWVNEAFCHMTGYSPAEAIGLFNLIVNESGKAVDFERNIWNDVSVIGSWEDITRHKRKDGTTFPAHIYITAIKNENNNILKYIAIMSDISREIERDKILREQMSRDSLTGLYNRNFFMKSLAANVHEARINSSEVHLILFNVSRLKNINSSFGFETGDSALQNLATRVKGFVNDETKFSRINENTFGIICTKEPKEFTEKLITLFDWPVICAGHDINLNISCGVATYPTHADNTDDLMTCALAALHRETPSWKSSYVFYSKDLPEIEEDVYAIENDMRLALEKDEFLLYYQPKIDFKTRKVISCEALVRWQSPRLGFMNPMSFIPLAEHTGLIVPLGDKVIEIACRQIKEWRDAGYKEANMAINISMYQLLENNFIRKLKNTLEKYDVNPTLLEFEITESIAMTSNKKISQIFEELNALGIKSSIDDFGTGYSSFAQLMKFPLNEIKIDRSFVTDIQHNEKNYAVVSAIISMAGKLNLTTVAEGVETEEEFAVLDSLGCDVAQGYLFSKPVPANVYEQFLEKV